MLRTQKRNRLKMNRYDVFPLLFLVFFGINNNLYAQSTTATTQLISTPIMTDSTPRIDTFPNEQWQTATPETLGFDGEKLNLALSYLQSVSGRDGNKELFISRYGQALWRGESVAKQHKTWSVTKVFVSTVLGLLAEDGRCHPESQAQQFEPDLAEHYGEVTFAHFASMTSGYRAEGDEPQGNYIHGPSKTPYQVSSAPLFEPGSGYAYWDSAANMYANALTQCAGERLDNILKQRIADPIGMQQWRWRIFDHHKGLPIVGGAGNNNASIELSAESAARFGLLILARGRWGEQQLLSSDWIDRMTTAQTSVSLKSGYGPLDGRGVYGFNWWVNGMQANGERFWPEAPAGTVAALGFNNNALFVIPEWSMVIARLGQDQRDQKIDASEWSSFFAQLRTAMQ